MTKLEKNFMRQHRSIKKVLVGAIRFFAVVLIISTGKGSAAEQYHNYVMDQNYFSCEIPIDWDLV